MKNTNTTLTSILCSYMLLCKHVKDFGSKTREKFESRFMKAEQLLIPHCCVKPYDNTDTNQYLPPAVPLANLCRVERHAAK